MRVAVNRCEWPAEKSCRERLDPSEVLPWFELAIPIHSHVFSASNALSRALACPCETFFYFFKEIFRAPVALIIRTVSVFSLGERGTSRPVSGGAQTGNSIPDGLTKNDDGMTRQRVAAKRDRKCIK